MAKVVAKSKAKKKKWYRILAPKLLAERLMGEAHVTDPEVLIGRSVKMNMTEVTGNRKLQNFNISCQIKEFKDNTCYTFVKGFDMNSGAVKRFVRKGRDRIDDSIVLKTADGLRVRVKPMVVTHNNTSNAVLTRIRLATRKSLARHFSKKSYNEVLEDLFNFNVQKDLKKELSKIYPVRNVEIRVFRLLDKDKVPADTTGSRAKKAEEKKEVKAEKEEPAKEKKAPAKKAKPKKEESSDEEKAPAEKPAKKSKPKESDSEE